MYVPHGYAQTNIQLYNQLRQGDYSEPDLRRVKTAYDLAINLFGGLFRPNGKAFISHLIGTASILAAQKANSTSVAAGLLHAAYIHGRFRDPRHGATPAKRTILRDAVGDEIETLLAKYANLRWDYATIKALSERDAPLDAAERDVVMIRLANELEDLLDLGLQYGGKSKGYASKEGGVAMLCSLAEGMGLSDLARELESVLLPTTPVDVTAALVRNENKSFVVDAPVSWQLIRFIYHGSRNIRKTVLGPLRRAKSHEA